MLARVRADITLVVVDTLLTASVYFAALVIRFDGAIPDWAWTNFNRYLPFVLLLHLGMNWVFRLYGPVWRYAGAAEVRRVLLAGGTTLVILVSLSLAGLQSLQPKSILVIAPILSTFLAGLTRFQYRLFAFNRNGRRDLRHRIAVIGAGDAGGRIIRELRSTSANRIEPVFVLDDDPRKRHRSIGGVPVLGTIDDLPRLAEQHGATDVLLAIPSADASLVQRVARVAEQAALPVKVLPRVHELIDVGNPTLRDVRDLSLEDLLGRQQVSTDLDAIGRFLGASTVLITGAGGSIGSEIARQVAAYPDTRVVLLDSDETHLHDAAGAIYRPVTTVLCDIREAEALRQVFLKYQPKVVFHAAALKHVPILEHYPCEAVATNIAGTRNLVRIAAEQGIQRLVFISTDKAVKPSSVMGATKFVGEQLMMRHAPEGGQWCGVRFGNVLGSRGSVIPTFARQIASGGPVTVTDERMTRYFMSVREAVQLVLQSAALARGGEIFMLDMGEPVRIVDLAERMIRLSGRFPGKDIAIEITGTRPGEKLEEQLRTPAETPQLTAHPSIVRLSPRQIPTGVLDREIDGLVLAARERLSERTRTSLFGLVATVVDDAVIDLTEPSPTATEAERLAAAPPPSPSTRA